ncbi:RICIN domain-containing protein [Nonomuraea lactucae]|uniref:RICIN domain-containing protein n=1 Tax=Nonomuraea lactucae TaxID=2249762 RepID=UPI000DE2BA29|nr:ricin-type beta-trefoil lectin domain protein [Nonomuraea lactucae]
MRSWKRGTARVAMVVGMVTAGAVTVPGTAHAGTEVEIWNNYHGLFLDSDINGNVYAIPRQNNKHQKWTRGSDSRFFNVQTGRCLRMVQVHPLRGIRTAKTCSARDSLWVLEKVRGGVKIINVEYRTCLASGDQKDSAGARTVVPARCDSKEKQQLWSVRNI